MKRFSGWSIFFGLVFLIWFLVSMVGLIYFAGIDNTNIVLAIFGQYFFVFGLVISFGAKEKIGIIFFLVGFAILVGAGVNMFGTEEIMYVFNEKVVPILFSAVFLLPGLGMLIIPRYIENKKKNRCTLLVDAKCVRIGERYDSEGGIDHYPVFEFYAGGEIHTYSDLYMNVGLLKIGDSEILYLNPEDFYDVYRPSPSIYKKLLVFVGGIWIIFGGSLMYIAVSDLVEYIIK